MAPILRQFLVCFLMLTLASQTLCLTLGSAFDSIKELEGSKKGNMVEGLFQVNKYLHEFGYLDTLDQNNEDVFDDKLESAIKTYQENYNLDVTGILDFRTISSMMTPRCGVPDIVNGTNTMRRHTNTLNRIKSSQLNRIKGSQLWNNKRKYRNHLAMFSVSLVAAAEEEDYVTMNAVVRTLEMLFDYVTMNAVVRTLEAKQRRGVTGFAGFREEPYGQAAEGNGFSISVERCR